MWLRNIRNVWRKTKRKRRSKWMVCCEKKFINSKWRFNKKILPKSVFEPLCCNCTLRYLRTTGIGDSAGTWIVSAKVINNVAMSQVYKIGFIACFFCLRFCWMWVKKPLAKFYFLPRCCAKKILVNFRQKRRSPFKAFWKGWCIGIVSCIWLGHKTSFVFRIVWF